MLDEDFDDYDDYDYGEPKSVGDRLKTAVIGLVIAALVVVVGATVISNKFGKSDAYGRIVAAGELYDAPTYQENFSAVSYEVIHPELATSAVEEVVTEAENPELIAENTDEVRNQKAMDNILKIDKDYVNNLVEERKKYKTHEIVNTDTAISMDPSVPVNLAEGNVDYYAGTIAPAIYVNPAEVGAEYLGNWKITAYCACVICCEKSDGITASGAMVQANHTIAAPKEFKFGTKMIVGGQLYVVEDRGGGIHGNRIDIYFNSHQEANNFGVRYMDVYVIRE